MQCRIGWVLFLCCVPAMLMADDFQRAGAGNISPQQMAELKQRMLQELQNGKIPDEIKKMLDRNRDGNIDPQEMAMAKDMMAKMQAARGGGNAQFGAPGGTGEGIENPITPEMVKKYDKNGDGQLDAAEKKTALESLNKSRTQLIKEKLDTNGDGKIDDAERKAAKEAFKAKSSVKK